MTAPKSMPAPASTAGCTNTMYAIVRNVTAPARSSVATVVPCSFSRKKRSSMGLGIKSRPSMQG